MLWDISQAYQNSRYDKAIKSFLGACKTTFSYPACSAPAWSATGNYPAGSQVRYPYVLWNTLISLNLRAKRRPIMDISGKPNTMHPVCPSTMPQAHGCQVGRPLSAY
jgi:hypothetical protein